MKNLLLALKTYRPGTWVFRYIILLVMGIILIPVSDQAVSDLELIRPSQSLFKSKETRQLEEIEYAITLERLLGYAKAIDQLDLMIEEGVVPKLVASVYYHRGRLHQEIGDDEQAAADYKIVLDSSPAVFIRKDTLYRMGELMYRLGKFKDATQHFTEATTYFPDDERHQRAVFQMGYSAMKERDFTRAIALFDSFIVLTPDIQDFGHFYKAETLKESGQHEAAIRLYEMIEKRFKSSPLISETQVQKALCYLGAGQFNNAIKHFQALKRGSKINQIRGDYYIALCYSRKGDKKTALKSFRKVMKDHSDSEYALYSLDQVKKLTKKKFSPTDFYYAGYIRYDRRELSMAATNFQVFIEKDPKNPLVSDARFMMARTYHRQEKYKSAISGFKAFLSSAKDHPRRSEAIYYLGNSYARNAQYENAVEQFNLLLTNYPKSLLADDALLDLARCQESLKDFTQARSSYEKLRKNFPRSMTSQKAQFEIGLNYFMDNQFLDAEKAFNTLIESKPDPEMEESATYWLAQSYFGQNQRQAGAQVLELLEQHYPDSYYLTFKNGWFEPRDLFVDLQDYSKVRQIMANDLVDLKSWLLEKNPKENIADKKTQLANHTDFKKALILTSLGLRDEAKRELLNVEKTFSKDPLVLWHLLNFYLDESYYLRSITCARKIADTATGGLEDTPDFITRFIYPVHFPELVFSAANMRRLDPLFLSSLIRQESMFDAEISSWANAHGLMQIIPPTARYIAKSIGVEDFELESLFSPKRSLEFGTWYFVDVLSQCDNRAPRALAGYNGGPGNINRWVKMSGDGRDDLLSEKITYKETRKYVRRILSHYRQYQLLWGDLLKKEI